MVDSTQQDESTRFLMKTCRQVINGELSATQGISVIQNGLTNLPELPSLLTDVLVVLEQELDCDANSDRKDRFIELYKSFAGVIIPDEMLKLALDAVGDESLNTKIIKAKTRLFYKQLKFNLLREESEGYAKLITELNQEIGLRFNSTVALERIRSLIGQFNLDPNRVLDIMLECFECRPEHWDFYASLLALYTSSYTYYILGFKFTFYWQDGAAAVNAVPAPASLFRTAALLLRSGFISLLQICQYLLPNTDKILHHHTQICARAEMLEKKAQSTLGITERDFISELDAGDEFQLCHNQRLCLLRALLEVGAWEQARSLLDRLPEFYAVRYREIALPFCYLINDCIHPFYMKSKTGQQYSFAPQTTRPPDAWFRSVPTPESWSEVVETVFPMLNYLGPYIYLDPVLFVKVVRLCRDYVSDESNEKAGSIYCSIVDLCDEVLLPALSLLTPNPSFSEEIWSLLILFPYHVRYRMYSHWKTIHLKQFPPLQITRARITAKVRYILKRLSKETTKVAGRQIGKIAHTHPIVVVDYILRQIQQFENLIGPVVESLRFLTNLSLDVLAFSIIDELCGSGGQERVRVEGINISPWLQSMAQFSGAVFRKYSIELTGVLQYVANQLKAGKSFDLLVLKEIVQNMSGIETTTTLTSEQLEALGGGDLLRQEGGYLAQIRNTKRSINRLKDALLQEDLVVGLCILMAQQRCSIVFKEGVDLPLKLVAQMLDQCQETLVQFGSFLSTNLKPEDYLKRMPPANALIMNHHCGKDAAFFLSRPMYNYLVNSKFDELKKPDKAAKTLNAEIKTEHYLAAADHVMSQLAKDILPIFPENVWIEMSPAFYCTFWTLSMYDIHVPKASYEREIEKLRKLMDIAEQNRELSEQKRRKERERSYQFETKLKEELRRQEEHVGRVMARLQKEKSKWFPSNSQARVPAVTNFIQHCIFPRSLFTDLDALYCANFFRILHVIQTPNFNTLLCYDRILGDMMSVIMALSENEANCFGRFLCAILEMATGWHKDQELFEKECFQSPGFATRVRNADLPDTPMDNVDHSNYLHVVYKWHYRMTKAFVFCLTCGSYVPMRNSLILLIKILPYFPLVTKMVGAIQSKIALIRDAEKDCRQDLHALATSYWGQLKVRKVHLYTPCAFKGVLEEVEEIPPPIAHTERSGAKRPHGTSGERLQPGTTPVMKRTKSGTGPAEGSATPAGTGPSTTIITINGDSVAGSGVKRPSHGPASDKGMSGTIVVKRIKTSTATTAEVSANPAAAAAATTGTPATVTINRDSVAASASKRPHGQAGDKGTSGTPVVVKRIKTSSAAAEGTASPAGSATSPTVTAINRDSPAGARKLVSSRPSDVAEVEGPSLPPSLEGAKSSQPSTASKGTDGSRVIIKEVPKTVKAVGRGTSGVVRKQSPQAIATRPTAPTNISSAIKTKATEGTAAKPHSSSTSSTTSPSVNPKSVQKEVASNVRAAPPSLSPQVEKPHESKEAVIIAKTTPGVKLARKVSTSSNETIPMTSKGVPVGEKKRRKQDISKSPDKRDSHGGGSSTSSNKPDVHHSTNSPTTSGSGSGRKSSERPRSRASSLEHSHHHHYRHSSSEVHSAERSPQKSDKSPRSSHSKVKSHEGSGGASSAASSQEQLNKSKSKSPEKEKDLKRKAAHNAESGALKVDKTPRSSHSKGKSHEGSGGTSSAAGSAEQRRSKSSEHPSPEKEKDLKKKPKERSKSRERDDRKKDRRPK